MWHAEGFLGERGKVLIDLYFLYACILAMILLKNHHLKNVCQNQKNRKIVFGIFKLWLLYLSIKDHTSVERVNFLVTPLCFCLVRAVIWWGDPKTKETKPRFASTSQSLDNSDKIT